LKKNKFPHKKKSPGRDGHIEKGREDVGSHHGPDTLVVFVRKSSRESAGISMSSFLKCNKTQMSQNCEEDKYPTIVDVLNTISMCISSMCPTTVCSVGKGRITVMARQFLVIPADSTTDERVQIFA
jgi:hypothetical protein